MSGRRWMTIGSVAFISLCAGFGLSSLGQATSPMTVAAVLSQAIPGDGKEVRMITVEYAPGAGIATASSSGIGIR
jgi:hypothetical protein